jgi:hypothetical protein
MNIYIYIFCNIFVYSNALTYIVIKFTHLAIYITRLIDKELVRCIHMILEILARIHALDVILIDVSVQSYRCVSLVKVLLLSHSFSLALSYLHW